MFRSVALPAVLALSLVVLAGCKEDHETLMNKMSAKTDEAVNVLKGVKDKASADAAAVKLKALGAEMKEIEKKMAALPEPTEEQAKKAIGVALGKGVESTKKMFAEVARIASSGHLTPELQKALGDVGGAGAGAGGLGGLPKDW